MNKYKESGTGPVKCIEWIHGLLHHIGLQYTCQSCAAVHGNPQATTQPGYSDCTKHTCTKQPLHDEVVSLKSSMQAVTGCVSQIAQQIIELKSLLHLKTHKLDSSSPVEPSTASSPSAKLPYAAAASDKWKKAVKTAVAETLREQRATDWEKTLVVIRNLSEHSNDVNDVRDLYEYLGCKVAVAKAVRIKSYVSPKKPRLLRVELASASDKNSLLASSKFLKDDSSTANIYIAPWLLSEELAKLRLVQSRCRQLNDKAASTIKGRKPYIVISGKIMERRADGSLRPFREPSSTDRSQGVIKGSSVSAFQNASAAATAMQSSGTKQPRCESKNA